MENFSELKLKPELLRALDDLGFTKPTPIQAQSLPLLVAKATDFVGRAATGTGKTAAFGLGLFSNLDLKSQRLQVVVLCPTRELAVQTADKLTELGKYLNIQVPAIYGGTGYREQKLQLLRARVITATPGRLIDHLEHGTLSLESVKLLILDEADEMISMGFKDALEAILNQMTHAERHTWLFSATMPPYLEQVARTYLKNTQSVHTNRDTILSGTTAQFYYTVRDKNKAAGLVKLIEFADDFYGLVFCQTKVSVIELTNFLRTRGLRADCLHGDRDQRDRERTLQLFKDRKVNILVCTDVAARGLDVDDVTHVINYTLPYDKQTYIHRIGRTGRSGRQGIAASLVTPSQMYQVHRLEKLTKTKFTQSVFPNNRQVAIRRQEQLLEKFKATSDTARAREILSSEWIDALASLSREEIAHRFLTLLLPSLLTDSSVNDEAMTHTPAPTERHRRPPQVSKPKFHAKKHGRSYSKSSSQLRNSRLTPTGRTDRPRRPRPYRGSGPARA